MPLFLLSASEKDKEMGIKLPCICRHHLSMLIQIQEPVFYKRDSNCINAVIIHLGIHGWTVFKDHFPDKFVWQLHSHSTWRYRFIQLDYTCVRLQEDL